MHKLDLSIARLSMLLAEVNGKREALMATRHQYEEQIKRLISFAVHEDGGVDRTLTMLIDVDMRLQELDRQDRYLSTIRSTAQRELDSLRLTKVIEEARAQIAALRSGAGAHDEDAGQARDPLWVAGEIRRLESVIAEASGAAARAISQPRS